MPRLFSETRKLSIYGSSDNSEDENGNAVNISDNIESDLDDPEET